MRLFPEVLKVIGALILSSMLRAVEAYPQPGPGRWFFLLTFGWPLVFAPLLLWLRRGLGSLALRVLEVGLLGWTSLMSWFAAGMDPGIATYVLVSGSFLYGIGAAWADILVLREATAVQRIP